MKIKNIGDSTGIVYHYTKLESAVGIIKEEGIIFHAGRYDAMNDPNDSIYGAKTIEKELGHEMAYILADPYTCNITSYLVSFCREDDQPLMWRLYDAEVMLHIDSNIVKANFEDKSKRMLMGNVDYLSQEEVSKKVVELFQEANHYFNNPELEFAAKAKTSFIKVNDFECEQEWRVAWFDDFDSIDDYSDFARLKGDDIASEIKIKGKRYDGLSFYRELKFPKDCLKGITIRAYDDNVFEMIRMQLRTWLAQCGYDIKKIEIKKTRTHKVR